MGQPVLVAWLRRLHFTTCAWSAFARGDCKQSGRRSPPWAEVGVERRKRCKFRAMDQNILDPLIELGL